MEVEVLVIKVSSHFVGSLHVWRKFRGVSGRSYLASSHSCPEWAVREQVAIAALDLGQIEKAEVSAYIIQIQV